MHYVTKWNYENRVYTDAACGQEVVTVSALGSYRGAKTATYRKNHVTCGNCRRTKVFRGVR